MVPVVIQERLFDSLPGPVVAFTGVSERARDVTFHTWILLALDGKVAVSCTRNPL